MFFLSKFLPLFLYPLGLACLLLAVAIASLAKRPQRAKLCLGMSLGLLVFGGNSLFAQGLLWTLEGQNIPAGSLPQAAAIVVLGGATYSADPPRPWVELTEAGDRVLYGAKLFREDKAPLVILSGGRVPMLGGGNPEAADMANLMMTMGVPAYAIRQDDFSLNTYENAVNVQKILQTENIYGPILLVTSAFHMPRSLAIFHHLGINAIAAPSDFRGNFTEDNPGLPSLLLSIVPQANALDKTTLALKEYIGLVIYRLKGWL
ncbi:MAG: YdcF family protein [Aphanocapsa sp. GSE-SYN-MK-11-07L]|jgi:uncharacterized SAM-binding protein YcdF (DUF218 family)|nr:YdcF family protein [Aphanocapsa sp. GSE-SYN-MK-11-07L]